MTKEKTDPFDFWYAVNNTEVIRMPSRHLETFGATVLNYHLISELMDSVDQVRVREGRMQANQPKIITPEAYSQTLMEGFGSEAREYVDWLRTHETEVRVLQYGYSLKQEAFSEYVVTDKLPNVVDRVKNSVQTQNDPLAAVVIGVDMPWDVCLVKLFWEIIRNSARTNLLQMEKRRLFEPVNGVPRALHDEIESAFLTASRDPAQIADLGKKLQRNGIFEQYQDRFFSLIRASKRTA